MNKGEGSRVTLHCHARPKIFSISIMPPKESKCIRLLKIFHTPQALSACKAGHCY